MIEQLRNFVQRVMARFFKPQPDPIQVPPWESDIRLSHDPEPAAVAPEPANASETSEPQRDKHVVCSEWTLAEVLRTVELHMERSRRSASALHGWGGYLDRTEWQGIKRITAHCLGDGENALWGRYEYADTVGWPSHGGLMMSSRSGKKDGDTVPPDSLFFIRHQKLPWNVRGPAGIPYECVIVWSFDADKEKRTPFRFFVTMNEETGKPQACEFLQQSVETVRLPPPRRRNDYRPRSRQIVVRQWKGFEEHMKDCAETEWEKKRSLMDVMPYAFNAHAQRAFSPMVIVSGPRGRVSFGVPLEQCPDFFKDRGLTITNKSGRRAPIIHWVKAHEKHRNGRTIATRVHLRGERRFKWRGYDVSVVIPGLHVPLRTPDSLGAVTLAPDEKDNEGLIPFRQAMTRLQRVEDGQHAPELADVRQSA